MPKIVQRGFSLNENLKLSISIPISFMHKHEPCEVWIKFEFTRYIIYYKTPDKVDLGLIQITEGIKSLQDGFQKAIEKISLEKLPRHHQDFGLYELVLLSYPNLESIWALFNQTIVSRLKSSNLSHTSIEPANVKLLSKDINFDTRFSFEDI